MNGPPPDMRRLHQPLSRARLGGVRKERSKALLVQLRHMLVVALAVLSADLASKALIVWLTPSSTIPHYTHPNPLALVAVLVAAPIVLRVIDSRLMMVALGVCIGGCAGNLAQHVAGMPVTDFIPLPHFLVSPSCQAGHSCVLMCNLADLALWVSVPLLAVAFGSHALHSFRTGGARHVAA